MSVHYLLSINCNINISFITSLQLSEDQDMKGAAGRRSQSPIDHHSPFYTSTVDNPRGTPVGASDDESTGRSANGTPHSIVQISDEPVNIYDSSSLKRTDSLQGV